MVLILHYPSDEFTAKRLQFALSEAGIDAELWNFMNVLDIDKSALIIPLVARSICSNRMFVYDGYFFCLSLIGLPKNMVIAKDESIEIIESEFPVVSFSINNFSKIINHLKIRNG